MANTVSNSMVLEASGLCKRYDGKDILHDVSFSLSLGEALGVIGPSGAGKSTLLRLMHLLEPFHSGIIRYFGTITVSVQGEEATITGIEANTGPRSEVFRSIRQKIGLVFQNLNLWDDRTVMDNLTLAPRIVLGESVDATRQRALDLCRRFSIENKAESRVWQLSGGQKQRVAIVRALMMRPQVMLLDEITSALDPGLVLDVMDAIRELRSNGMSFMLVTHHLEFASSVCDRIMYLEAGRLVQIGPPSELRADTADPRVRRFWDIIRSAT